MRESDRVSTLCSPLSCMKRAELRDLFANRKSFYIYGLCVAEQEGFEPSIRGYRIHTFQACAFDHSATAPHSFSH